MRSARLLPRSLAHSALASGVRKQDRTWAWYPLQSLNPGLRENQSNELTFVDLLGLASEYEALLAHPELLRTLSQVMEPEGTSIFHFYFMLDVCYVLRNWEKVES